MPYLVGDTDRQTLRLMTVITEIWCSILNSMRFVKITLGLIGDIVESSYVHIAVALDQMKL